MYELSEKMAAALTAKEIPFTIKPHHVFSGELFEFPWTEGDFFVTFWSEVHYHERGEKDFTYAESYGFPWDIGGPTCWGSDEKINELIEKIFLLYDEWLRKEVKETLNSMRKMLGEVRKKLSEALEILEASD